MNGDPPLPEAPPSRDSADPASGPSLPNPNKEGQDHGVGHPQRLIVVLGVMLLLGVGLGVGGLMMVEHVGAQIRFYGLMALVAAMAALLILVAIVVAILKWFWRSRGASVLSRLWQAVSALAVKSPEQPWPGHVATTWRQHGPILWGSLLTAFAFLVGLGLLHPIVTGLFSFASYLSSQAQVEVTVAQNFILAIDQQFQQKSALAEQRFTQISTVLLNADSPPGLQQFALSEIVDAMLVDVPRVDRQAAQKNLPQVVYSFPNLDRLRNVLRQFMRTDRVRLALAKVGKKIEASQPLPDETSSILVTLGPLSDELLHTLHRLGPIDPSKPDENLWRWNPDANGISEGDLDKIPKPREPLPIKTDSTNDTDTPRLILRHFRESELAGLCIPHACNQGERWHVDLTGMNLDGANLMEADFSHAHLSGARFVDARMDGIDLSSAQLAGANLKQAMLYGADFAFAELPGANLNAVHIQGGNLNSACLVGADMSSASMESTDLSGTVFDGARMDGVQMLASSEVNDASFFSVRFDYAQLRLTQFQKCRFQGASFRDANFAGTTIDECELHGVDLAGAKFYGGPYRFGDLSAKQFAFDFGSVLFVPDVEDGRDYPTVTVPGVLIANCTHEPQVRFAFLVGLSGAEVTSIVKEKPALVPIVDGLNESFGSSTDWREWLPYLTEEAVARIPLPLDAGEQESSSKMETLLEGAFGDKHVEVCTFNTLLVPEHEPAVINTPEAVRSPPMFDAKTFQALTIALDSPAQKNDLITRKIREPAERLKEVKTLLHDVALYPSKPGFSQEEWDRKLTERQEWMRNEFVEQLKAAAAKLGNPATEANPPKP